MKQIISAHNETYTNLRKLAANAKHRRRAGQTLVEGVHLCEGYLNQLGHPSMYVYTESATEQQESAAIIKSCEDMQVSGILLSEAKFRAISSVENGVGVMFVVDMPQLVAPETLTTSALLLEGVQDPGNMGTILRTAAAAGVTEVHVSGGSVAVWSPKVLRAGMGAHYTLRIYENCDLAKLITDSAVPVLATSLGATKSIYDKDLLGEVAWLFGSEGGGVSSELLAQGVQQVIIPQNSAVESLNVAAAVAVCLFEQVRQRGGVAK